MKPLIYTLVLSVLFMCVGMQSMPIHAQEVQRTALSIPTDLVDDANAVIRNEATTITLEGVDRMHVSVIRTVTVLNKFGDRHVGAYAHYDPETKINTLEAVVYDALGNELKKFKKKDIQDFSASGEGSLYTDDRVKVIDYTPTTYPYTFTFKKSYTTTTTGFIPPWYPIDNYKVAVQHSSFKVINSGGLTLRFKEFSFNEYAIEKKSSDAEIHYEMNNQKPIAYEEHSALFIDLAPHVLVATKEFNLKGVRGQVSNWKEFGQWESKYLLEGRDELPIETVEKVRKLVEGITDPIEKAKVVYNFMQDKTRYISVQVGIGGWEPIAANQVDKVGYGDCKGLTNYTKALLKAVGVPSYYVTVYAKERRDIDKDFTSIQGNHVILAIPNKEELVWLECTSQIMPFGFLGSFTDDRDVLVVTPEGGVIKRTPAYVEDTNLQTIQAELFLDVSGEMKGALTRVSKGIQYYNRFYLASQTQEDLDKHYKRTVWPYNNKLSLTKINHHNDKDKVVFTEEIALEIPEYGLLQQENFLFKVNVFNRSSSVPKRYRNRTHPLFIQRGYKDVDEVLIHLPEGYQLETLPAPIHLDTKFGLYEVTIEKISDKQLKYTRSILQKHGTFPKEEYTAFRNFKKKINKYDNLRLLLTKTTN